MKTLRLLILCLVLASCATPTVRLPSGGSYNEAELKDIRRCLNRNARMEHYKLSHRVKSIHYDLIKSAGAELCNYKLQPAIGILFTKSGQFIRSSLFSPFFAVEQEMAEDNLAVSGQRDGSLYIEMVMKNSAAAKAGLKAGDRLVNIYGVPAPFGEGAYNRLAEILEQHANDGQPVDLEVERGGKTYAYSVKPDMICPYPLEINTSDSVLNAYADGEKIIVTLPMLDFITDDDVLAAVIGHELAHNNLGHIAAAKRNSAIGLGAGFLLGTAISGGQVPPSDLVVQTGQLGQMAFSKEFELEADYIGAYYVARAGYDYHKLPVVQEKLSSRAVSSLYIDGESHPTPQRRYALLRDTVKELDEKKRRGEPLLPAFNQVNSYLESKD